MIMITQKISPVAASRIRLPKYNANNLPNMPMSELFKTGVAVMESVQRALSSGKHKIPHRIEGKVMPIPNMENRFFRIGFYNLHENSEGNAFPTLYAKYLNARPFSEFTQILGSADGNCLKLMDKFDKIKLLPKAKREAALRKPIYCYLGNSVIEGTRAIGGMFNVHHQTSGIGAGEVWSCAHQIFGKNIDNKIFGWNKTPFRRCLESFLQSIKEKAPKKSDFEEITNIMDGFYH